ncbi:MULTISPECIES: hypothetical protein [Lactobacillus]|uniref:hypothetical protein n=1 Tax=Lactobacillus TaxID=1578 RepID=UPI000CD8879C|nr:MULTISPECIES: hypothetical protein [Lactobacillus]RVU73114.1 hypothetical protein EJK20_09490 [Lactobacillus xujianguonis]
MPSISILPKDEQVKAVNLLRQSVTDFIRSHTLKLPKNFKAKEISLNTDNYGYINNENEQIDAPLAGTVIDYLTRLVIGQDVTTFDSLENYFQSKELSKLIHKWKGYVKSGTITIDNLSLDKLRYIIQICTYEQQFRNGHPERTKIPLDRIDENTLTNFKIMLKRADNFFKRYGYPKMNQFTCVIGNSDIINDEYKLMQDNIEVLDGVIFGDGDYISDMSLIDFKAYNTSKSSPSWTKQLLMYYIGLQQEQLSDHGIEKSNLKILVDYNPRYDKAFEYDLSLLQKSDIINFTNQIKLELSTDTSKAVALVNKGSANLKQRSIVTEEQGKNLRDPFRKYADGIHEITREEYLRFYKVQVFSHHLKSMISCKWSGQYYLVKSNNYYMFFLKRKSAKTNSLCYLDGGTLHKADFDLDYYYDNLQSYGDKITHYFSSYETALKHISNEVKLIGGTGIVHGSIVDIDFLNHIFLEPANGQIKIYYAEDTGSRKVFSTMTQLLADNSTNESVEFFQNIYRKRLDHHDMLENLHTHKNQLKYLSQEKIELLNIPKNYQSYLPKEANPTIDEYYYDTEMYYKSRVLRKVQYVFDIHTIRFWRDAIIHTNIQALNDNTEKHLTD